MKNTNRLFYSRCLLALCAVAGTLIQLIKYGAGMLLYYTVLSNLLVSVFALYMVWAMVKGRDLQETKFLRIKAAVTMSIMITFVIYHFMLAALAKDFWRVENILCHYITPLYFFFDTLFVDKSRQYHILDPISWTALPVIYMIFAFFNGLVMKLPIPDAVDSPFPYYFLNVYKHSLTYVLTHVVIIFVAYVLAGYLLYLLKFIKIDALTSHFKSKSER